jgi:cell division protein FtsB
MKPATRLTMGVLTVLLVLLQAKLWVSDDGFREVARLNELIERQTGENDRLGQRNLRLEAEVNELRRGGAAVEERARADLGLVGPGETFFIFSGREPQAD